MKTLVKLILVLGVAGLAFSGYLTYQELFASSAEQTCTPLGAPGTALGAPPCVYGFVMYLIIVLLAVFALIRGRTRQSI
ncbi:MAG TPA: hypothetical protein VFQ53_37665 [Kofleriaceae bacterium]|nr:hypothetical protein [Kofleriaceae bacterium]